MPASSHRSWFSCPCGQTFRSVTHRKRGLRRCPSCHLQADHRQVAPPTATNEAIARAESHLLNVALAVAHCSRSYGWSFALRSALDELKLAETAYRIVANS